MPDQKRLTPEMLVPRMGEYLVQKVLVSADDIQKALAHQQEETDRGNNILLGQALIDLHLFSRADLDQAVTEQIIQLRSALQASKRSLERRVEERPMELQKALERVSELSQLKANHFQHLTRTADAADPYQGLCRTAYQRVAGSCQRGTASCAVSLPAIHKPARNPDR